MSVSKAQQRAVAKYIKNNYDRMEIKSPKGTKALIENAAKLKGESVNSYIKRAISAQYKAEIGEDIEL